MHFEVGDRVIGLSDYDTGKFANVSGTIVEIIEDSEPPIGVEWDVYVNGHDCNGKCTSGFGWYVYEHMIRPLKPLKIEVDVPESDFETYEVEISGRKFIVDVMEQF